MNLSKLPEVQSVPEADQNNLLQEILHATLNKDEKKYKLLVGLRSNLETAHNIAVAFGSKEPMKEPLLNFSLVDSALQEIAPNEIGFSQLLASSVRLLGLLKKEKKEYHGFLDLIQAKLVNHGKTVLLDQQYMLQSQEDDMYGRASAKNQFQSELLNKWDQIPTAYFAALVNACSQEEIMHLFIPVVVVWVAEMNQFALKGDLVAKDYLGLMKKISMITEYPPLIALLVSKLKDEVDQAVVMSGREMENQSILACFLKMNVVFESAKKYYSTIPGYPNCHIELVYTKQEVLRASLNELNALVHGNMRKIFAAKLEKYDMNSRDVLLRWIAKILELNEVRTTANARDELYYELISFASTEGLMLNLTYILLLFCKPFLDRKPERVKAIDQSYCVFTKLINFDKEARLFDFQDFVNLDVPQNIKNGEFGFIPNVFFLTFLSIHVGLMPSFENFKVQLQAFNNVKAKVTNLSNLYGPQWKEIAGPNGDRLSNQLNALIPIVDGFDCHLGDPNLLTMIMDFFTLAMSWMMSLETGHTEPVSMMMFSKVPEYFIKDMLDIMDFLARMKTKYLAACQLNIVFDFLITFMARPDLVKSPLMRARLAIHLSELFHLYKQPEVQGISAFNQNIKYNPHILNDEEKDRFGLLFNTKDVNKINKMIMGLMRTYIDIGAVEGLDVDKDKMDKYSVRKDIAALLNKLWPIGNYKKHITDLILANSTGIVDQQMASRFLSTVLSDSIMLLDDSLHRLIDIKTLQEAMENTVAWNAQPLEVIKQREAYFRGQEHSAGAFLSLAIEILDFLIKILEHGYSLFLKSEEMLQKLVSMLIYFFGKLCGPQMSNLNVKNPEKYKFNPKNLLGKIASIACYFADSEDMVNKLSMDLDYSQELMKATTNILTKYRVIPNDLLSKFQLLVNKTNEKKAKASESSGMDVIFSMDEINDTPFTNEEGSVREKKYVDELSPFLYGQMDMILAGSAEDGSDNQKVVYDHHYDDNIRASANFQPPRQRTQYIVKDIKGMQSTLTICRGGSVFVRSDNNRLDVLKAVIIGPEGTPYGLGAFLYDIFFPTDYPHNPPLVNLETTGHGTVRFSPNLYVDGKVCLSLLGTWHGDENSKWKPLQSTMSQALISIQGLVMVAEPYYLEPSYEAQRGTQEGDLACAAYNEQLQYNTIRYAMIEQIQNPSKGFEEAIHKHFYLLKDEIMKMVKGWYNAAKDKPKMLKVIKQLSEELINLKTKFESVRDQ
jgi:ubiquitin-protein ligase